MNINIDKYIDNSKPKVTIFGKDYEVDNDYKKVLGLQDFEAKAQIGEDISHEFLSYALVGGEKAADEILSHKFSFDFFQTIQMGVSGAMTNQTIDQIKKNAEDAQKKSTFHKAK